MGNHGRNQRQGLADTTSRPLPEPDDTATPRPAPGDPPIRIENAEDLQPLLVSLGLVTKEGWPQPWRGPLLRGGIVLLFVLIAISLLWQYPAQVKSFFASTYQSMLLQPRWWVRITIFAGFIGIYPLAYLAYRGFGADAKRKRLRDEFKLFGLVDEDKLDETVEKLYANVYGWTQFAAYIVLIIFVSFFVFVLFFQQQSFEPPGSYVALLVIYGYLGAYIFSIQELIRRYNTFDLQPQVYSSILVRMLISIAITFILGVVFFATDPPTASGPINIIVNSEGEASSPIVVPINEEALSLARGDVPIPAWMIIVAFVVGVFPETGIRWLVMQANRILNPPTNQADELPLRNMLGISTWHETRLAVMGIDDAQNLATVDIPKLLLTTQYDTQQVANWIDQAILYVKVGNRIGRFREAKITTFHEYLETLGKIGLIPDRDRNNSNRDEASDTTAASAVEIEKQVGQRATNLATILGLNDPDELQRISDYSNYPNYTHISLYYEGAARVGSQRAETSLQRLIRAGVIDRTWVTRLIAPAQQLELLRELERLLQQPRSRFHDPEYCTRLGIIYYKLQQRCKAKTVFNRAIELDGHFADAYYARSHLFLDQNELEQAIWDVTRAIKLKPYDAEMYNHRGEIYLRMVESEQAIDDLNRAISLNPQMAITYLNRAAACNAQSAYDEAIADLERAQLLGYDEFGLWHTWGLVLLRKEDYAAAVEKFYEAIRRNKYPVEVLAKSKDDALKNLVAEAYANRGNAYFERGVDYIDEAERDYKTSVTLNSRLYQSYNRLGIIAERRGDLRQAIEHYETALKIEPNDFDVSYNLGDICYKTGVDDQAVQLFRRLYHLAQTVQGTAAQFDSDKLAKLESLATRLHLSEQHLAELRGNLQATEVSGDLAGQAFAHRQLGQFHNRRGEQAQALDHYAQARDLYLKNDDTIQQQAMEAEIKRIEST